MGNCYSETPGSEITIQDNAAGRPNRKAMAEFDDNQGALQPDLNIEELEK